jgi:hypothetical protein
MATALRKTRIEEYSVQPTLLDWVERYENSRVWSAVFDRRGFVCFSTAAHHAK